MSEVTIPKEKIDFTIDLLITMAVEEIADNAVCGNPAVRLVA